MRTALLGGLCAALLVVTGCTESSGGSSMNERQRQDAVLQERPNLEAQVARLTLARDAARDALAQELDLTAWSDAEDAGGAGCGEFSESSGETAFLPTLVLTDGVPDALWPRAVEVVERAAGEYGFGPAETVVDRPGEHEMVLRGEWDALLRFGSILDATLSLETGCHLPERFS
jgi:hypothetical protein